ncbi:hypothetical protein HMPREF9120_02098 [Neisseria sp. oral taxon 020 str. F0370]|nr:hypothetical protein HMPREF9120_02098 [Neisseria sp. oral taxon 020 str. F0370]
MAEADALPGGDKVGGAADDGLQQDGVGACGVGAVGVVAADEVVGKLLQSSAAAGVKQVFEMAEAQKVGGEAGEDGGVFLPFAVDGVGAAAQGEGAGGGDAEAVHGFGTQVFAHARTQHGAAVGKAGIRGFARTFELPLPEAAVAVVGFADQQGAAVAEFGGVDAELVACVGSGDGRRGIAVGAARQVGKVGGRLKILRRQAEIGQQVGIGRHPIGLVQRLGTHGGIHHVGQFGQRQGTQRQGVGHGFSFGRGC